MTDAEKLQAILRVHAQQLYDRWGNRTTRDDTDRPPTHGWCRQCHKFDGTACRTVAIIEELTP